MANAPILVAFLLVAHADALHGVAWPKGSCIELDGNLCDPWDPSALPVLITGSAGSGTHSTTQLANINGIKLGHEDVKRDGAVAWPWAGNVPDSNHEDRCGWCDKPKCHWLDPPGVHFRHVYHLVRCPIDSIGTLIGPDECFMNYIGEMLHLPASDYSLKSFARGWLELNKFVEGYAEKRFRVDQMGDLVRDVCETVKKDNNSTCGGLYQIPVHAWHHDHRRVTWEKLFEAAPVIGQEIYDMAVRYGFGPECLEDHDDHIGHLRNFKARSPDHVTTRGIPGAECGSEQEGADCTDGIEWVWDRKVVEELSKTDPSFKKALEAQCAQA